MWMICLRLNVWFQWFGEFQAGPSESQACKQAGLFKPSENTAAELLQLEKTFRRNGFNYKMIFFLTYLRFSLLVYLQHSYYMTGAFYMDLFCSQKSQVYIEREDGKL